MQHSDDSGKTWTDITDQLASMLRTAQHTQFRITHAANVHVFSICSYCSSGPAANVMGTAEASDAPDEEDAQGVLDIHFHPWQPRRILIQGPGYTYWVTEDFGATYKAFKTPGDQTLGFWMEIKIHPRRPDWILSKVRRKDCLVDLTSAACAHDLFISQVGFMPSLLGDDTVSCAACKWQHRHVS